MDGAKPAFRRLPLANRDRSGRVTAQGRSRIQKFGPGEAFRAVWGSAGSRPRALDRPTDVAIGCDGRVYVVDYGNNRVRVFARRDTADHP